MDFGEEGYKKGMALLIKLKQVADWTRAGDPRAQPYLDANAVCMINGEVVFDHMLFLELET